MKAAKLKLFSFLRHLYYLNYYRKFRECGSNVILSRGGFIARPQEISLGSDVFISTGFRISARNLSIGSSVMIGPNLLIECDDHRYDRVGKRMFQYQNDKLFGTVTIEDDVWLGANVSILANVRVGEGSVIGAGSVVTKNVLPYTVNAGVPARPLKLRFPPKDLQLHLSAVGSIHKFNELITSYEGIGLL